MQFHYSQFPFSLQSTPYFIQISVLIPLTVTCLQFNINRSLITPSSEISVLFLQFKGKKWNLNGLFQMF